MVKTVSTPSKFPVDEHVDIHVSQVVLDEDAETETPVVEIREFLKEPGLYGHGIVIPMKSVRDLRVALERLG